MKVYLCSYIIKQKQTFQSLKTKENKHNFHFHLTTVTLWQTHHPIYILKKGKGSWVTLVFEPMEEVAVRATGIGLL